MIILGIYKCQKSQLQFEILQQLTVEVSSSAQLFIIALFHSLVSDQLSNQKFSHYSFFFSSQQNRTSHYPLSSNQSSIYLYVLGLSNALKIKHCTSKGCSSDWLIRTDPDEQIIIVFSYCTVLRCYTNNKVSLVSRSL